MIEDFFITSSITQIKEPGPSRSFHSSDSAHSSLILAFFIKQFVDHYLKAQEDYNKWLRNEHSLDVVAWLSQRLSEELLQKISGPA